MSQERGLFRLTPRDQAIQASLVLLAIVGSGCAVPSEVPGGVVKPQSSPTTQDSLRGRSLREVRSYLGLSEPTLTDYIYDHRRLGDSDIEDITRLVDQELLQPTMLFPLEGELRLEDSVDPTIGFSWYQAAAEEGSSLEVWIDPISGTRWTDFYLADGEPDPVIFLVNTWLIHRLGMVAGSQDLKSNQLFSRLTVKTNSGFQEYYPERTDGFVVMTQSPGGQGVSGSRQAMFLDSDLLVRIAIAGHILDDAASRGYEWALQARQALPYQDQVLRLEARLAEVQIGPADLCRMYYRGDLEGLVARLKRPGENELDVLIWMTKVGGDFQDRSSFTIQ